MRSGHVVVKGKMVVDSPKKIFSSEVSYKFGGDFTTKLGTKFIGKRFYTSTNDQSVGGLTWERKDLDFTKDLKVSLTVSNLFNKQYDLVKNFFIPGINVASPGTPRMVGGRLTYAF